MEKPYSTTHFICLFRYRERIRAGLVLLAEAASACLFGTYQHPVYLKIRLEFLSPTNLLEGLNRSDPLKDHLDGRLSLGKDAVTYKRQRMLVNCLKSGPQTVYRCCSTKFGRQYPWWCFWLSRENFRIPIAIARAWKLERCSTIRVQWDALEERQPTPYALRAGDTDEGRGVGIRVFTTLDGEEKEYLIQSNTDNAVLVANTLYDFLHGLIVGQNYNWLNSRRFIFRCGRFDKSRNKEASSDESSSDESSSDDQILKLKLERPIINSVWDDETRQPETKPSDLPSPEKQKRPSEERRTSKQERETQIQQHGDPRKILEQADETKPDNKWIIGKDWRYGLVRGEHDARYPGEENLYDKLTSGMISRRRGINQIVDHRSKRWLALTGERIPPLGTVQVLLSDFTEYVRCTRIMMVRSREYEYDDDASPGVQSALLWSLIRPEFAFRACDVT